MITRYIGQICFAKFILLIMGTASNSATMDAAEFQWRFVEGQRYDFAVTRDVQMIASTNGKTLRDESKLTITGTWEVKSVNEGKGEVVQTIDHVAMRIARPGQDVVDYDSKKKRKNGDASSAMFGWLVGSKYTMVVSPRGKIETAKLDSAAHEKLWENPFSETDPGTPVTDKDLRSMAEAITAVIPDRAVVTGDTWSRESSIQLPGLASATVRDVFTQAGTEKRRGDDLDKFDYQAKCELGEQFSLKGQSFKGAVYFDRSAGRFVESNITQELTAEFVGEIQIKLSVVSTAVLEPTADE